MPVTEEFLKHLPSSPGVYMMLDRKGVVLYVGKAGNLKNRVRNYFGKGGDERHTVRFLMARVESISTILTDTEKEALLLENNLIKQHKPKYNVLLRDDKSFFSLRLNISHPFPGLSLMRTQKIKPDGERYFGPYSSATDARVTLKFIQKLFPLRQCTDHQMATCKRPCLNCQMHRCLCPCTGYVDKTEYGRMIDSITLLLLGRNEELLRNIKSEMETSARDLKFERAARLRDLLTAVERTLEKQNVSFFHLKDQDVIAVIVAEDDLFVVQVLSFRKGNLLSGETFTFRNSALDHEEVLTQSIKRYYADGTFVPKEILISRPIDQPELIATWLSELRGSKVTIRVPARGEGSKLMQLALKNAHDALLREKQKDTIEKTLERIAGKLRLPKPPRTIEGYDISNISGSNPVGVKILFKDGRPDKSGYRKYKIRGYTDQDDPGMINQTIARRVSHAEEEPLPDLFLIDGGKSQLNAAILALKENLGSEIPAIASIAKAREDGDDEKFYLPNRKDAVVFHKGDFGLMLLMRVRDEAHRFAHTFQTKSRSKDVLKSALDDVPGIGPKKRHILLTTFGSVKALLEAPDDKILETNGIIAKDLERIRTHFSKMDNQNDTEELLFEE